MGGGPEPRPEDLQSWLCLWGARPARLMRLSEGVSCRGTPRRRANPSPGQRVRRVSGNMTGTAAAPPFRTCSRCGGESAVGWLWVARTFARAARAMRAAPPLKQGTAAKLACSPPLTVLRTKRSGPARPAYSARTRGLILGNPPRSHGKALPFGGGKPP